MYQLITERQNTNIIIKKLCNYAISKNYTYCLNQLFKKYNNQLTNDILYDILVDSNNIDKCNIYDIFVIILEYKDDIDDKLYTLMYHMFINKSDLLTTDQIKHLIELFDPDKLIFKIIDDYLFNENIIFIGKIINYKIYKIILNYDLTQKIVDKLLNIFYNIKLNRIIYQICFCLIQNDIFANSIDKLKPHLLFSIN